LEAHFIATGSAQASAFINTNLAFDIMFLVEVLMRAVAYGRDFFSDVEWRWNAADAFTALLCPIPDIFALMSPHDKAATHQLSIMRFLLVTRVARVTRTARLFKGLQATNEFQKMVIALLSSAKTLLWSMMLLFFVMFFFSLIFCHAVAQAHIDQAITPSEMALVEHYFGSLPRSWLTAFMSIANGLSWHTAFDAMSVLHWHYRALFLVYIVIVQVGVLNVVTSVFVESALLSAQRYKHLIIQAKESERQIAMRHLHQVFQYVDVDKSGEISSGEMERFWDDPNLRQYISALDIDVDDAWILFRLLDRDGSGSVDITEFCEGCFRLKGEAKSTDMQLMMLEMQMFLDRWSDFTVYVEDSFNGLRTLVSGDGGEKAQSLPSERATVVTSRPCGFSSCQRSSEASAR